MTTNLTNQILHQLNQPRRLKRSSAPAIDPLHGQGYVLCHLGHRGALAQPGELCAELGITSPRMTSILAALERQGLLRRLNDVIDRRRIIVKLTDDGRALVQEHDAQQLAHIGSLLDALGEEDAKACARILDKVLRFEQSVR